jgi:uncharacterized protein (TIGR02266 family)
MSKKKKNKKGAPATPAAAPQNPHSTTGEQSDWGAKMDAPWMAPKKDPPPPEASQDVVAVASEPAKRARSAKGANAAGQGTPTPSVMGFLAKVGTPQGGQSPARGLLGKVTAEDLKAVGRLPADAVEHAEGGGAAVTLVADPVAKAPVHLAPPPPPDPSTPEDRLARLRALNREENGRDKRRNDRLPFSVRVEYSTVGRTRSEMAENLSATGMFIHTSQPLEVGDPVMVHFSVPDSNMPLSLPARVKWVSAFGELDRPSGGMGLEFTALDERARRNLATVMARLKGGRA